MKIDEARAAAQSEANKGQLIMALAHNPYTDETNDDAEKYGYWPLAAAGIFKHETVVEEIHPEKN
jgi:hypothetical protein